MIYLAWLIAGLLTAIAAIVFLWIMGLDFPFRSREALFGDLLGMHPITINLPGRAGALIVLAPLGIALVVVDQAIQPSSLNLLLLVPAALILLARGALAWMPFWRRPAGFETFNRLDRAVYGPLALLLGAGTAIVAIVPLFLR
ncbi:hypothetical protein QO010_000402 [Caulobacter ginsengisoli]|uniref:DUF3995 domain-containing protein n=1 Tax=Caulobacter ginsengisoli TaxID=400775 RepID=A0ABU0IKV9_9CAUL|nr:hypothetical protein [Caulobacter ginsengisoli]MDQ0462654.1 hypothetical protein [Caulobacter ginsengisoli]